MEIKNNLNSPLEMPLSCKSALERIEREIREEDERQKASEKSSKNSHK
ncbi:hypothetical protein [Lactonifactor longoviformis]